MEDTLIRDCTFAALDFESAGVERGGTDEPIQIGVARCRMFDETPELWMSYLSPGKPVLWAASQVHGITTEMLKGAPRFIGLWKTVKEKLGGAVIVGHNPSTERRYLRIFPGHGFGPWVDTLSLARECVRGLPDYSLRSVAEALGVVDETNRMVPQKSWHDALYDAVASWIILRKIILELGLENSPLECLGQALKKR